jgi:hypothetical protein
MGYGIEQFSTECRRILKQDPGVEGRKQVCELVREVLKDDSFVATYLTDDVPERKVLYEDPELDFCILGHVYQGAKDSNPHDHGPSWAIYGQARGETIMTDYEPVARPGEGKPGKARRVKDYTLKPGMAYLYNEGDLHSPRRPRPDQLIRIEGRTWKDQRFPYERVGATLTGNTPCRWSGCRTGGRPLRLVELLWWEEAVDIGFVATTSARSRLAPPGKVTSR